MRKLTLQSVTVTVGLRLWSLAPAACYSTTPASHVAMKQLEPKRQKDELSLHAQLLGDIVDGPQEPRRKRSRVRGVVRKLESANVEWLAELTADARRPTGAVCGALLKSLCAARPFLDSHRLERLGGAQSRQVSRFVPTEEADGEWTGVSPFFSSELSDALCVCLRFAAQAAHDNPAELQALLNCAVTLELADSDALQVTVLALTGREYCTAATTTATELVEALRLLSLAVKRCKLQPPALDHLLCRLPAERALTARASLQVLSSLVRLRNNQRAVDVANAVSRNAVPNVPAYSVKDVVYGLEAVALLGTCHESYAGAVLDRCAELAPSMSPKAVGDACKYVALLQPDRIGNTVALSCGRELRRVLPALEHRSEQLLGKFSLRDARYVLRCFTQHRVRHSILFSKLTPFANDG